MAAAVVGDVADVMVVVETVSEDNERSFFI